MRALSRYSHRGLLAEADERIARARAVLGRPSSYRHRVAEEEVRRREVAELEGLVPQDDDGDGP